MHLFKVIECFLIKNIYLFFVEKNTLRLYSNDRLTAEQCIQHEAYVHLNGKHFQHRPYLDSTSPSPIDHHLSKS
jgi:hypothetical protein